MTAADALADAWEAWDRHPAWPHAVAGCAGVELERSAILRDVAGGRAVEVAA